jgi:hypothetical protein
MTTKEMDLKLREQIAVEVMGWTYFPYSMSASSIGATLFGTHQQPLCRPGERPHISTIDDPPHYETDIAAAWQVASRAFELAPPLFDAALEDEIELVDFDGGCTATHLLTLPTNEAASLICRAALKALRALKTKKDTKE